MAETRAPAINVHATAIVVGTVGIVFTGPSGSGKSKLAFACLAAARRARLFAALIADDQIFLESVNGQVIARRPEPIAGLMEFRGTGIGSVKSLPHALVHLAVHPVISAESQRLPGENEQVALTETISLPLLRLPVDTADPLAVLGVFQPDLHF